MDPVDIRIIETMGIYPFGDQPKPRESIRAASIAREIGLSVDTVKARVRRMEEAGIIAGYQVTPNLNHLGLRACAWLFRLSEAARGEVADEEIWREQGMLEVHDYLGRGLCLMFTYQDGTDLAGKLDRFAKSTGAADPVHFWDWRVPPVGRAMSNLDWRIVRDLRWNANRSLDDVANELGVTGRTVKRRLDRMVAERSVAFTVLFDASKVTGLFPFQLLFYLEQPGDTATVDRVLKTFQGCHFHSYLPASRELGNYNLLLFAESSAEVEALRRRGAAVPGVSGTEAWFLRDHQHHSECIDTLIDERVRPEIDA